MHFSNSKYSITSKKVLNPREEANLRSICHRILRNTFDGRNALLIEIALDIGPRAEEILQLEVKDFDPDEGTLFIHAVKGSNDRELPLKPNVARRLKKFILAQNKAQEWSEVRRDSKIFEISYHRLYQIWNLYRPHPEKTFHCLRHTFAVNLYLKTRDLRLVQLALGHRNISNTMVYLDFVYTQTSLRRLVTNESTEPEAQSRSIGPEIDNGGSLQPIRF